MRVVMNSEGYLCMAILAIKRHKFGWLQENYNVQIM